jgi:hypothetical protein
MRYLMMVKGDDDYEAGKPPSPEMMAAVGAHAEKMAKAGVLLDMGGLLPSAAGAKVVIEGGKARVVDGPFSESKELIGGYAILKADSKEEAIRLGREFMQLHVDVLGPSYSGELEIRQMADGPGDC